MDIVLGVSMAPTIVRLLLIEGVDADGVTIEEDAFDVGDPALSGAVEQVIAAIDGTREGAVEGGYRLASIGVTWSDPAEVGALREELAAREMGGVMLVSPLLAAAALAQTVGHAIGYEHIAMLFVEPEHATLAVVEVSDGSIVDLHRRALVNARPEAPGEALAAELATMVAALHVRGSWADGVFLIGCGTDIVSIKPALEAVTPFEVTAPEEPEMALARGAALASANAPLFASSTAALAYALDPGTGEIHPRGLTPTYLDISANADRGAEVLAYSAAIDDSEEAPRRRRGPFLLTGSALAFMAAVAVGVVLVSLTSDRPVVAVQHEPRAGVATPAKQLPAEAPAPAKPSPPSAPPTAAAAPPAPVPAPSAAPPPAPAPVEHEAPRTAVAAPPPAPEHRWRASTPVQRAVPVPAPEAPPAPPPAAPPPPAPPPAAPPPPAPPPLTMYLHFPFVTVPIPINLPPPPPGP